MKRGFMPFLINCMEDIVRRENTRLARPKRRSNVPEEKGFSGFAMGLQIAQIARFCMEIPCYEKLPFWWQSRKVQGEPGGEELKLFPGLPGKWRALFKRFRMHKLHLEVEIRGGVPHSRICLDPTESGKNTIT